MSSEAVRSYSRRVDMGPRDLSLGVKDLIAMNRNVTKPFKYYYRGILILLYMLIHTK